MYNFISNPSYLENIMPACSSCKEEKSLKEFTKRNDKKSGYDTRCKVCVNKKARKSYKKRHKSCPGCNRATRRPTGICKLCENIRERKSATHKICSKCKENKVVSEFYVRDKEKYLLDNRCKSCCKVVPPRKPTKLCPECNTNKTWKGNKCQSCRSLLKQKEYSRLTLGDKTYDKHKYAKYAYIRYYAKQKAKELGWKKCSECGYDKHFEVAHIRPISDFPPETLLTEVNSESNLKALCPNCHWEFDNPQEEKTHQCLG